MRTFAERLQIGVFVGIGGERGGVRIRADAAGVIVHPGANGEINRGGSVELGPEGEAVGPALAHATSFGRCQAATSSATCHPVSCTVSEL